MKSKTIIFRDPVVERVCDKFVKRSDFGYAKYGRTLHDERIGKHKSLASFLNDVQEELMDAILYIQAAKEEISDNIADKAIAEANKASFSSSQYTFKATEAQQDWDDAIAPV